MGKCVKCHQYFHPDFCVDIGDDKRIVLECAFCHTNKRELEIINDDGIVIERITKEQAINKYKEYIEGLKKNRNIDSIIKTGEKPRIIL